LGDEFSFTAAHEIFHCIQFQTWSELPDQAWLSEGTAEYFAFLVQPAAYAHEASFIAAFDRDIPVLPLSEQDYQAVVYFLWLGDTYGPERVREFIGSFRRIETAISADMWLAFAQAYFDQNIHLPDGAALLHAPQVGGTRAIAGDDHIIMPDATPFILNNAIFDFDEGHEYDLTHAESAPDARISWRKIDGAAWEAPLSRVSACDGDQLYRVIWMTTFGADVGDSEVRARPDASSPCTCPAGVWQETPESLRAMMEQSALGASRTRFISGTRLLRLNSDHTGSFIYRDVVTETHSSADVWLRQTKSGGSNFTWTIVDGAVLTVLTDGDNLLHLHNEQHSPAGLRVVDRRAGAQSIGHNFHCDADGRLQLTQQGIPGFSVDMEFTRVAEAPAP
jgi:hypothetical protein